MALGQRNTMTTEGQIRRLVLWGVPFLCQLFRSGRHTFVGWHRKLSLGTAAVLLIDMEVVHFIQTTTAANSSGQQALSTLVKGLDCHVD